MYRRNWFLFLRHKWNFKGRELPVNRPRATESGRPHNEPVDKDVTFGAHLMLPQYRRIPTKAVLLKLIYSGSFIVDPRCVFTFSPSAHIHVKLNFPPQKSPGIFPTERRIDFVLRFRFPFERIFFFGWIKTVSLNPQYVYLFKSITDKWISLQMLKLIIQSKYLGTTYNFPL